MGTKKMGSPFLQHLDDDKKFFFMNRVIFLGIVELVGVICNQVGCFLSCTEVQHSTSMVVTSISGDIDV